MKPRTKRPHDPIQLAKLVGDIATGQVNDQPESARSQASRQGGLKGGAGRAQALTPEQRSAIAHTAAQARWKAAKKP